VAGTQFLRTFGSRSSEVIEETDEAAYWIELLVDAKIVQPAAASRALWKEADELTRIFVSSRETVRRRLRKRGPKGPRQSQITNHKSQID